MDRLSGKTVLITGGSSGIGLEMARQLSTRNTRVIICGRSKQKLDDASRQISGVIAIQCDLTKKEDRIALVEKIANEFSDLSVLVNNAGIVKRFYISEIPNLEETMREELETNYIAPIILSRLCLPLLMKNKGMIANVSSGLAYCPIYAEPNYCATKAALHSITQSMRIEFAEKGVKVSEIFYPAVDTPFQQGHAPKFAITPEEAAFMAVKGLNSGKNEIRIGKAKLIYFMSRYFPATILKMMSKAVPKKTL